MTVCMYATTKGKTIRSTSAKFATNISIRPLYGCTKRLQHTMVRRVIDAADQTLTSEATGQVGVEGFLTKLLCCSRLEDERNIFLGSNTFYQYTNNHKRIPFLTLKYGKLHLSNIDDVH